MRAPSACSRRRSAREVVAKASRSRDAGGAFSALGCNPVLHRADADESTGMPRHSSERPQAPVQQVREHRLARRLLSAPRANGPVLAQLHGEKLLQQTKERLDALRRARHDVRVTVLACDERTEGDAMASARR